MWSFELTNELKRNIYTIKTGPNNKSLNHPKIPLKPSVMLPGVFCELDEDEDPPHYSRPSKHPYGPFGDEEEDNQSLYGPLCPQSHNMLPNFWKRPQDKLLLGCELQN